MKLSVRAEDTLPIYSSTNLTMGGDLGKNKLEDQLYTLRITHADALILPQ